MPGLIELNMGKTSLGRIPGEEEFAEIKPVGYEASMRDVDPTKETTAGQLQGLIESGSPYITRARTRASEAANARGLLNSSMAVQAGEAAAIDAALPIAASDAGVYGTAALTNQAARNAALGFGATASNQAGATNAAAGNQAARIAQSGTQTSRLSAQQAGEQGILSAQAARQAGELSTQQAGQQQAQTRLQADLTSQLQTQTGLQQQTLARLQGEIQSGQIQSQADLNRRAQEERSRQIIAEQAAAAGQQRTTLAQTGTQDVALQTLRGEQAQSLANVEAQYKTLVQSSASATDILKGFSNASTIVLSDTNTTVEQKQAAINTLTQMMRSSMAVIGAIANVDLTGILNFEGG